MVIIIIVVTVLVVLSLLLFIAWCVYIEIMETHRKKCQQGKRRLSNGQ